MGFKAWLYFGFTALLAVVLAGIMVYFFPQKKKGQGRVSEVQDEWMMSNNPLNSKFETLNSTLMRITIFGFRI